MGSIPFPAQQLWLILTEMVKRILLLLTTIQTTFPSSWGMVPAISRFLRATRPAPGQEDWLKGILTEMAKQIWRWRIFFRTPFQYSSEWATAVSGLLRVILLALTPNT